MQGSAECPPPILLSGLRVHGMGSSEQSTRVPRGWSRWGYEEMVQGHGGCWRLGAIIKGEQQV